MRGEMLQFVSGWHHSSPMDKPACGLDVAVAGKLNLQVVITSKRSSLLWC